MLTNQLKKEGFRVRVRQREIPQHSFKRAHDCGKTFLLNPLNILSRNFTIPATTTFAWVGTAEAEVVFLNDFRWSPQIVPWHDLLLLLEGQEVHLPAAKTHYKEDSSFKTIVWRHPELEF